MKIYSRTLFIFFISLAVFASLNRCANKVPPSGGPSDTIPPSLIYSNPEHQSTNVHTRVYEFRFDEKIKLQSLNRTLIVTPRIDFDYEVKSGKRSFILIFDEDFKDSTTYTFNFRDAVQDVTEGNPLADNIFTFSTGEYLDSLSIEGYAINLLKNDTLTEATIGLYIAGDTTTILNGSPYYFTQTNDSGYYKLNNIKNGKYLIYGFNDGNSNLTLETKNEAYAFKSDTIDLQQNIDTLNLYFVRHDVREFKILTALPSGKNFDINFNKYIDNYSIKPFNESIRIYANKVKENQSIRIYNTFYSPDSTGLIISATDSSLTTLQDTIWVKFNESKRKPDEFTHTITPPGNEGITENFTAEIVFNKPIALVDSDSILFRYDSLPVATIQNRSQILANKHLTRFRLKFKLNRSHIDSLKTALDSLRTLEEQKAQDTLQADTTAQAMPRENIKQTVQQAAASERVVSRGLHLYLGKTAFISVEKDSFPPTTINYQFIDREMLGTLAGTVETNEEFILQLLTPNGEVTKEVYSSRSFRFVNLEPGDYKLRLLIDSNGNGRWDYGNLLKGEEPEPVKYYLSPDGIPNITVRANWDITGIILTY